MTENGPVSAGALLTNFVEEERGRFGDRDGDILAAYAFQIAERVGYLEITADDYETSNARYQESLERFYAARAAEGMGIVDGSRPLTDEEQALSDEAGLDGLRVYLRIDTFYVFAKILLDKLARLVPEYFGRAEGVKIEGHYNLRKGALPRFAEQKGLTLVPSALDELIADLGKRVSDYRDETITHGHDPRTYRGTIIDLGRGRESAISTGVLYPQEAESETNSETPRTLLPVIESYVQEIVEYLKTNRDKADRLARSLALEQNGEEPQ